jgi:hypothetical protein
MQQTKPWYASKTIWANLVAFAATMATIAGIDLGFDAATQAELVAGVMAIVNVALRMITSAGVSMTPSGGD